LWGQRRSPDGSLMQASRVSRSFATPPGVGRPGECGAALHKAEGGGFPTKPLTARARTADAPRHQVVSAPPGTSPGEAPEWGPAKPRSARKRSGGQAMVAAIRRPAPRARRDADPGISSSTSITWPVATGGRSAGDGAGASAGPAPGCARPPGWPGFAQCAAFRRKRSRSASVRWLGCHGCAYSQRGNSLRCQRHGEVGRRRRRRASTFSMPKDADGVMTTIPEHQAVGHAKCGARSARPGRGEPRASGSPARRDAAMSAAAGVATCAVKDEPEIEHDGGRGTRAGARAQPAPSQNPLAGGGGVDSVDAPPPR
jgi:hypothetical protein